MMAVIFNKLIVVAAWALLAFIAYATISPIHDRPTLPTSSGFEHFAAFGVLGVLFALAYPRQTALVCLLVLGSALILEVLQLLTPDRHGRILDAVQKMAGGFVGIATTRVILNHVVRVDRWFES
jgi:VanZ family protein